MTAWLYFIGVVTFVSLLGASVWDLIGRCYTHEPPTCSGCRKGAMKPGCPIHDEQRRRAA